MSIPSVKQHFVQFKDGHKQTDLCEICVGAKQAIKFLNKCINIINSGGSKNNSINNIDRNTDEAQLDAIIDLINNTHKISPIEKSLCINKIEYLKIYLQHYDEYTRNNRDYNDMINNVTMGQCVLSADYKEKPKVGSKPDEESWVFRNMKLRNLLGVILEFCDERIVIDAVTNITNQTALLARCQLTGVLKHPLVQQKLTEKNIKVRLPTQQCYLQKH